MSLNNGPDDSVLALQAEVNGYLYVGGEFSDFSGFRFNQIARWKDLRWSVLGNGMSSFVNALAVDSQNRLYSGGAFDLAGGVSTNRFAQWDGQDWTPRGPSEIERVNDIKVGGNDIVYVAWMNTTINSDIFTVSPWNGVYWTLWGKNMDSPVSALALDSSGNLYAGGFFTTAGTVTVNYLARWDGHTYSWTALGNGSGRPGNRPDRR